MSSLTATDAFAKIIGERRGSFHGSVHQATDTFQEAPASDENMVPLTPDDFIIERSGRRYKLLFNGVTIKEFATKKTAENTLQAMFGR